MPSLLWRMVRKPMLWCAMSYNLLEFSRGGGCGCKIDPIKLHAILADHKTTDAQSLLVDFLDKDDAAIIEINNETCLIQTVDFFLPLVNNAFDFGRIAAANAIRGRRLVLPFHRCNDCSLLSSSSWPPHNWRTRCKRCSESVRENDDGEPPPCRSSCRIIIRRLVPPRNAVVSSWCSSSSSSSSAMVKINAMASSLVYLGWLCSETRKGRLSSAPTIRVLREDPKFKKVDNEKWQQRGRMPPNADCRSDARCRMPIRPGCHTRERLWATNLIRQVVRIHRPFWDFQRGEKWPERNKTWCRCRQGASAYHQQ